MHFIQGRVFVVQHLECCGPHVYCQDERVEASDIVTATLENTGWGPTKIATQIKMSYDQSFGAAWQVGHTVLLIISKCFSCDMFSNSPQVVVGESFSVSLDHELPSLLYMYSGSLSIIAWKCGSVLLKVLCRKF